MLTAALAVLCALLVLVLLVQRPAIWPVLVVLAVLWFALFGVFRCSIWPTACGALTAPPSPARPRA